MKERLPVIIQMKTDGIIGENFQGYLAYITDQQQNQEIVDGENMDREKIYTYIAQKEGADKSLVGIRRAKQIAENAKPGEYLQNEDGSWYQK